MVIDQNIYTLDEFKKSGSGSISIDKTRGILSSFTISITTDDGTNGITNTFDQMWYDFSIDYSYEINMDDDNILDIK